ncbi:hydrogenase/urease accessory protein (plasmid) [Dinoroseobacter shibae DFL 12 = DSM 16493]|jgi:urease accessory protein|uniref:Hydrogenase/urease accessory protein n=1 Tax=Dinoroseobacter shibae (strain DSM 16493 / NCIMB 14021 / DFL 12) TaxID=398580 RepID=A8LTG2_DINSH|nr:HupE/UreJ family protein [Dinoroseobacter shibae]ABV95529.1 hydrogenase/urease accessory protein [Dinoroseobacter shibae DFL 12 = DSM 16493]URF48871.1 HupE/UreJ family protein [Dinoroseobacter shibae]URF53183.1 HupE/UreJ family protein [Dinoroseobacter shibae]
MLHRVLPAVLAVLILVSLSAMPALAHETHGHGGGFVAGFTHPILGWDHVAAMVAVGLWGAFLGAPAIWILPVVFPLVMALGAVLGIAGVPVPAIETGIALSAVVLGLMIAFVVRPPLWVAAVIVGLFAVFHGYAHGTELPGTVNAFAYAVGFVISTGLLHMIGIAFGLAIKWPAGRMAVRGAGGLISIAGVAFLTGMA